MTLHNLLQQRFGYDTFRPGQQEVIEQLLNGKDVVAILPTGMGKSLCYQLPAYAMNKAVLVVSPLLSLMQDQVDQLKQMGEKRVIALNSFLTFEQKKQALQNLHTYRFIFTSPEMLLQPGVKERIATLHLGLIVADEAHCISQWGFDFRPDYLRLHETIAVTNRPPILALSATATKPVLQDIEAYLMMQQPYTYIHSIDRPNIALSVVSLESKEDKLAWIYDHVQKTAGPGIIYMQSRQKTEALSLALLQLGVAASSYHGGKDNEDRQFIQQQFIQGELEWIVATNAFGMGVHKGDIRQVIHASMPATVANYMQEIGRAGRDGEQSLATLLYVTGDEQQAKYVATDDLPKEGHVDAYLRYEATGLQPRQMLINGEISETAFRVIDYWLTREDEQQVKCRLQAMHIEKVQAVDEVIQLLQTTSCLREKVSQYFGQQLLEKPTYCCTYCGLNQMALVTPRSEKIGTNEQQTWQQRLTSLLL